MNNSCFIKIVLLLGFFHSVVADTTNCTALEKSFELCQENAMCTTSMYIVENDASIDVFEFLFTRLLSGMSNSSGLREELEVQLCSNDTNTSLPYQRLWTQYMSMYRYCGHINKYFDGIAHKCFCQPDKQCAYIRPDIQQFHFTSLHILVILMMAVFAFTFFYFKMRYTPLFKMLFDVLPLLRKTTPT